jgi:transposase-like protein
MMKNPEKLFTCRHFEQDVIVVCVCWYLRYKLSYWDLVEMMAERGLALSHTTVRVLLRDELRHEPAIGARNEQRARVLARGELLVECGALRAET